MPELPEVETIRRELRPRLRNKKIIDCRIIRTDVIAYPNPRVFCRSIIGETIKDVSRKAKYLILELTNDKNLIFHLRLSGTMALAPPGAPPEKFTRLALKLENQQLFFNEPRVLGRAYLLKAGEKPGNLKGFFNLGCEPISPEFDAAYLKDKIKHRKANVKSLLLDQNICAGMGNIYSDEALYRAGIRPMRRAYRITNREMNKLITALRDVINEGIDNFGTSVADYHRTDGRDGSFQNFLCVYGREGEPCRKCGTTIVAKKIGNRSTRYCPKCQK
jgi:formamidopyrimidine-DNA glycosylase